jgi:hypothetical protein
MQTFRAVRMPDPHGRFSRRDVLLHSALAVLITAGGYSLGLWATDRSADNTPPVTMPNSDPPNAGLASDRPAPETEPSAPLGDPRTPEITADEPIAPRPELESSFNANDFLQTWAPCSTVTVRLDATIPDLLALQVRNEARTTFNLAGLKFVGGGRVDLELRDDPDRVRSVAVGEVVIGLTREDRLDNGAIGQAAGATVDGNLVSSLIVVDESLVGTEQFLPVLRHELGHAVGLPHSDNRSLLMFPSLVPGAPGSFQLPELAALSQLSNRPCDVGS